MPSNSKLYFLRPFDSNSGYQQDRLLEFGNTAEMYGSSAATQKRLFMHIQKQTPKYQTPPGNGTYVKTHSAMAYVLRSAGPGSDILQQMFLAFYP